MGEKSIKIGEIMPPLPIKKLPEPPPLTFSGILKWGGPAIILGSLGVGGFEAYHAAYVAGKGFVGIFWLYILSTFFQVLINREVGRWTMATGETVTQGVARIRPKYFWPWFTSFWVAFYLWPAWITGAAAAVAVLTGLFDWIIWSALVLIISILLFYIAPRVYSMIEKVIEVIFFIGFVGIVVLSILAATPEAAIETLKGWLIPTIPAGVTMSIIGPFLLQPGGGPVNYFHTYWVRERSMGMGAYIGKVTGLVAKPEEISPTGFIFDTNDPNEIKKWHKWMRLNTLTLVIFMALSSIILTFFVSMLGCNALLRGIEVPSGWKIAVIIAELLGKMYGPLIYTAFLFVVFIGLFDTQFGFYDAISRTITDSLWVLHPKVRKKPYRFWYFIVFTIGSIVCLLVIPLGTPYIIWLIVNWIAYVIQICCTVPLMYINAKYLPKEIKPKTWEITLLAIFQIVLAIGFILWTRELFKL
ncbi:MAG: Nramp family divalent metal transporter [Candidatus Methanomethylicia archaeon]